MPLIINQTRDDQIPFKRHLYVMPTPDGGFALYHGKFFGRGVDWLGYFATKEIAEAEKDRIENSIADVIRVRCSTK